MKRALPWLVRCACRAGTRDVCSALTALVGSTKYLLLAVHYFNSFVPIAQQAGQAALLGRLSLIMCLWCQMRRESKEDDEKVERRPAEGDSVK